MIYCTLCDVYIIFKDKGNVIRFYSEGDWRFGDGGADLTIYDELYNAYMKANANSNGDNKPKHKCK